MQNTLPSITYNLSNPSSEKYRSIEVNGEIIHWIEDIDKFYKLFGYTQNMKDAGVLPQEFISDEFTSNHEYDFTVCMQIQIIEYLRINSHAFSLKYGNQCERWLSDLEEIRAFNPSVCMTCKIRPFC